MDIALGGAGLESEVETYAPSHGSSVRQAKPTAPSRAPVRDPAVVTVINDLNHLLAAERELPLLHKVQGVDELKTSEFGTLDQKLQSANAVLQVLGHETEDQVKYFTELKRFNMAQKLEDSKDVTAYAIEGAPPARSVVSAERALPPKAAPSRLLNADLPATGGLQSNDEGTNYRKSANADYSSLPLDPWMGKLEAKDIRTLTFRGRNAQSAQGQQVKMIAIPASSSIPMAKISRMQL